MAGFFQEFKEFAMRGNVVDLAVGIIIGVAFGEIVNSLVKDIIMPLIGLIMGDVDFSDLFINLSGQDYPSLAAAREAGAPVIAYGSFINAVINFIIVAFAIFLVVKGMNWLRQKAPEETPVSPRQEILLEEIRDILKARSEIAIRCQSRRVAIIPLDSSASTRYGLLASVQTSATTLEESYDHSHDALEGSAAVVSSALLMVACAEFDQSAGWRRHGHVDLRRRQDLHRDLCGRVRDRDRGGRRPAGRADQGADDLGIGPDPAAALGLEHQRHRVPGAGRFSSRPKPAPPASATATATTSSSRDRFATLSWPEKPTATARPQVGWPMEPPDMPAPPSTRSPGLDFRS